MIEEKNLPLVSVVVPCYNHEKYVQETIESILSQTYRNIELIVIDDGSKDNSVKVIQKLADKYNFIFMHRPNKGLNATLNELLKLAKGEFIAQSASDDFWAPIKIEEQVKIMSDDPEMELCFTEHFDIDENSKVLGNGKYKVSKNEKQTFNDVILNPDFPPASIMYRKNTIKKINFRYTNDREIIEDLYSWLYILSYGGYAYVIKEKLAYYRTHDTNTHSDHLKIAKGHMKTLGLFKDKISNWREVEIEWSLRNSNLLIRTNKKESFEYLLKGICKIWDIRIYKVLVKLIFGIK